MQSLFDAPGAIARGGLYLATRPLVLANSYVISPALGVVYYAVSSVASGGWSIASAAVKGVLSPVISVVWAIASPIIYGVISPVVSVISFVATSVIDLVISPAAAVVLAVASPIFSLISAVVSPVVNYVVSPFVNYVATPVLSYVVRPIASVVAAIAGPIMSGVIDGIFASIGSKKNADLMARQFVQIFVSSVEAAQQLMENEVEREKISAAITKITQSLGQLFNKGNKGFLEGLNIADSVRFIGEEIGKVTSEFRYIWYREIDGLRSDVQQIFANMARDTVLRFLPWVLLGTAASVATPLAVYYIFKRAVYAIGKPSLVTKVKKTGWFARTKATILSTTQFALVETAKVACMTGAITGLGIFLTEIGKFPRQRAFLPNNLPDLGIPLTESGLFPRLKAFLPNNLKMTVAQIAVASAVTCLAYRSIKWLTRKKTNTLKPIFAPAITRRIDDIIEGTKQVVNNPNSDLKFQNLLLYGPGGTGKTALAERIAEESGMDYYMMSGGNFAQFISSGLHVTKWNDLMNSVKNKKVLLFIDEADAFAVNRDSGKMDRSQLNEILGAFLASTGAPSSNLMIVMATNRIEDLDKPALTRMDHQMYIGPPDIEARREILMGYLKKAFSKADIDKYFSGSKLIRLVYMTDGLTGRAIEKLVNVLKAKNYVAKASARRGWLSRKPAKRVEFNWQYIQENTRAFVQQELRDCSYVYCAVRTITLAVTSTFALIAYQAEQTRQQVVSMAIQAKKDVTFAVAQIPVRLNNKGKV